MMNRFCVLAVTLLWTSGSVWAQSVHPHSSTLQQQATSWLRANNAFGPDHRIVTDLSGAVQESLGEGRNFTMTLGPKLTKSGRATIVASWGDRLFTFELTEQQQRRRGVEASGVDFSQGSVVRDRARTPAPVRMRSVSFEGGPRLDGDKELKGSIEYNTVGIVSGEVALRIAYSTGGSTVGRFDYIGSLSGNGTKAFGYEAINAGREKEVSGPVVVFCDLCQVREIGGDVEITVLSNPVAVLLDVE